MARKIKRKRQERKRNISEDSDTSEDSANNRKTLRFRSAKRNENNQPRIFQYGNKKDYETQETKQEMDVIENNQNE